MKSRMVFSVTCCIVLIFFFI